jgi:hypothetical protein
MGGGVLSKSRRRPHERTYSFQKAPRCSATSKRTRERCKAPAVRGWPGAVSYGSFFDNRTERCGKRGPLKNQ